MAPETVVTARHQPGPALRKGSGGVCGPVYVCPGQALGGRMMDDAPDECLGNIFHTAPGVHIGTPGGDEAHVPPK